jgi:hypothetical protein
LSLPAFGFLSLPAFGFLVRLPIGSQSPPGQPPGGSSGRGSSGDLRVVGPVAYS